MATPQFGVKATDLGRSNFQGTVQAGVVDKSKAMEKEADMTALAKGTELGINTYQDYDKSQVLGDVAKDIGGVITDQQDRSLAGQQALEGAIVKGADEVAIIQSEAGYDGTYPTVLNQQLTDDSLGIQNAIATQTEKLTNARQQGIMGDLELKERLAKITREAITANPAYANEIMGHVSAVSSMNNLTARVAEDLSTIKDAKTASDARDKEIRREAYDIGIAVEDYSDENGAINYTLLKDRLSKKIRNKAMVDEMKLEVEAGTVKYQKDAKKLIDEGLPNILNDSQTDDIADKAVEIMNDPKMTPANKIIELEKYIQKQDRMVSKWYSDSGANVNAANLKPFEDTRRANAAGILKSYTGVYNGETNAQASKNFVDYMQNENQRLLFEKHPRLITIITNHEVVKDIGMNISGAADLKNKFSKEVIEFMTVEPETLTSPVTNNSVNNAFKPLQTKNGGVTSEASIITMAALDQTLKANPEEGAVEAFTDTLQRRTTWMANTPEDTGPATANLIKDLSNPKMTQGLTSITDPSLISELDTAVNSYKPILKNALDSFKKEFPEAKLQIRENDGMLFIPNADRKYTPFMQNNLRSINDAARAHYNVNKLSPNGKNASAFYADILGEPDPKKAPSQ